MEKLCIIAKCYHYHFILSQTHLHSHVFFQVLQHSLFYKTTNFLGHGCYSSLSVCIHKHFECIYQTNSLQFISTITAPYQPNFLTQLKLKCIIQPEVDASISKVMPDCLQCHPSYALFCKLCLGQEALSKLLTFVKWD